MTNINDKNTEIEVLPRPGSVLHNFTYSEEKHREKMLKKYRNLNKFLVLPLYRLKILPLLGFGRIILIITTIGRITGKKRKTPLEYHWIEGIMTIFSGRGEESGWVKNIYGNPESVWVRHGFHSFPARVEFVVTEEEKLRIIKWYIDKHSKLAKMLFGWNKEIDDPETMDFSKLLNSISIIQLFHKGM
ncbi:MAG: nitroreductase/quinone reductase family protein [Promethearchaeota archaeon]|jgi:deazaflavin-dependent oxidoreductase (nitroreductase family)